MADTPEATIRMAADAYMAGNAEGLAEQLDENVRIHGSEWEDHWNARRLPFMADGPAMSH